MAALVPLELDYGAEALKGWQLAKRPSIVQTAITAAKLTTGLFDASYAEAIDVLPVEGFPAIRFQIWAVGTAAQVPIIDLYGWQHYGPGHHIGTLSCTLATCNSAATTGFHALVGKTHKSITDVFTASSTYLGVSTYTETADYDDAITVLTPETNFPSYAIINFAASQYKFFSALVTSLDSATTVGAIFRPVALKGMNFSPDGL